jgi:hypothetical protein
MGSSLPLVIVVAILAVTSVTALIASFVRERRTFAGYDELRADIAALKSKLNAEVFRDGTDLVISGTRQKLPVVVRFSYAENTPGLNVRVHGPSTINFAIVPRNAIFNLPENLRATLSTTDDIFNSRFQIRADDGASARMFLMGKATVKELAKALCSSRTTLNITHGALELSETTIPQPNAGGHAAGHIDSLLTLSAVLAKMPGAQLAVVDKPQLPKRLLSRTAIVFGAAAALLSIIGAVAQLRETPVAPPPLAANQLAIEERSAGVIAVDAKVIPSLDNFRVVKPAEFNPSVVSWMKGQSIEPDGRVPLMLNKSQTEAAEPPDVAYLLTDPAGNRRLVILYGSKVLFDAPNFGPISILRVPAADIPAAENEKTPKPEGDGLLVVTDPNTPEKTFLLYLSGNSILHRTEPNWTQLNLR